VESRESLSGYPVHPRMKLIGSAAGLIRSPESRAAGPGPPSVADAKVSAAIYSLKKQLLIYVRLH